MCISELKTAELTSPWGLAPVSYASKPEANLQGRLSLSRMPLVGDGCSWLTVGAYTPPSTGKQFSAVATSWRNSLHAIPGAMASSLRRSSPLGGRAYGLHIFRRPLGGPAYTLPMVRTSAPERELQ